MRARARSGGCAACPKDSTGPTKREWDQWAGLGSLVMIGFWACRCMPLIVFGLAVNREITELGVYPYRAVTHLYVTFPDGSVALGTGAVVGRNDILTATHVVYNPNAGGWARDIRIAVGADYNSGSYRYESPSLVDLEDVRWSISGFPSQTFSDSDNDTLTFAESQSDVALIGLSQPVGDQVGYFAVAPGYDSTQLAYQIGYPQGSPGMMFGPLLVQHHGIYDLYEATSGGANQLMGPGSSGGPLYVVVGEVPVVIGVRSSGSDTKAYWADLGYTYEQLLAAMSDNDQLISGSVAGHVLRGSVGNDVLYATGSADTVEGGAGLDTVVYASLHSQYVVTVGLPQTTVGNLADASDIDALAGIERLSFVDGMLAIDVGAGQVSGSAYRLYQAAFDRQPDIAGLNYWIDRMDSGMSLQDVAQSFGQSPEFQGLFGVAPRNETLITSYYLNVLDREPDESGYAYWLDEMSGGLSASGMLASFSESMENQLKVSGALENGIWLA